jgi:cytochrome b561
MQPVNINATRYDTTTILFHWLVALLVVTQWIGAQTIDFFPKGDLRVDARSLHIVGGATLGVLLVLRLFWRGTVGRQLPPVGNGLIRLLAKIVHWGLYLAVAAQVLVGLSLAWARGDSLFGVYTIPSFSVGNKALVDQITGVHASIGWLIVALVVVHSLAALVHQGVWRDGVLDRMRFSTR